MVCYIRSQIQDKKDFLLTHMFMQACRRPWRRRSSSKRWQQQGRPIERKFRGLSTHGQLMTTVPGHPSCRTRISRLSAEGFRFLRNCRLASSGACQPRSFYRLREPLSSSANRRNSRMRRTNWPPTGLTLGSTARKSKRARMTDGQGCTTPVFWPARAAPQPRCGSRRAR
jgi:hypothetical protein